MWMTGKLVWLNKDATTNLWQALTSARSEFEPFHLNRYWQTSALFVTKTQNPRSCDQGVVWQECFYCLLVSQQLVGCCFAKDPTLCHKILLRIRNSCDLASISSSLKRGEKEAGGWSIASLNFPRGLYSMTTASSHTYRRFYCHWYDLASKGIERDLLLRRHIHQSCFRMTGWILASIFLVSGKYQRKISIP